MLTRPVSPAYGTTLPRVDVPREEPVRHGVRSRSVVAPRPRTALAGVAVVVALTLVGLFYLSQTFQAAAARYEVDSLLVARQAMLQELKSQEGTTAAWGSEGVVTQWAQGAGLDPLGARHLVTAR